MLIHPRIEVQINRTRAITRQDEFATMLSELIVDNAVASIRLLFVAFESIFVLLGMVVAEPVYLA